MRKSCRDTAPYCTVVTAYHVAGSHSSPPSPGGADVPVEVLPEGLGGPIAVRQGPPRPSQCASDPGWLHVLVAANDPEVFAEDGKIFLEGPRRRRI